MSVEYGVLIAFSCFLQTIILSIVYQKIGTLKLSKKVYAIFTYLLYYIISIIIGFFVNNNYVSITLDILLLYALGMVYKINLIARLITPLVLAALFSLSEMLVGAIIMSITSMTVEETQNNFFYFMQGILGSKIIVLFLALIYKNTFRVKQAKGLGVMNACLILIPITTNVVLYIIQELMAKNTSASLYRLALGCSFSFLAVIIILVYIIDYCIKMFNKQQHLENINISLNEQIKSFNNLVDKYKFNNKQMHDINNQFIVLKGLCSANVNCDAEIEKVERTIKNARNIVYTGNAGVDAILNEKFNIILAKGIDLDKTIILSEIKVDIVKLSILIANLLDNAIEESIRLQENNEQNKIVFKLYSVNQTINLYIKNRKRKDVKVKKTSKNDKFKHGYGKEIVQQIVEELNGNIIIEQTENDYAVSILIVQV